MAETQHRARKQVPRMSVGNDDLVSIREATRKLGKLTDQLETGDADQFVLTHHGKMVAVLLPVGSCVSIREQSDG